MSAIRLLILSAMLALLPVAARAQPSAPSDWLNEVRHGGYVIVLRHGATTSDQSNTDSMSRKNVPAERRLTELGSTQARLIGASMRKLKIPVGPVLTSPVQRAVDTARLLGFGDVTAVADLAESGPAPSSDENDRRARAFRKLVAARPPSGDNVVIVSHKPNIVAAFGTGWSDVHEGEASIFEPDGEGGYKLIARIQADGWNALTGPAD
jgi:broad specificity phosphatase PhoE